MQKPKVQFDKYSDCNEDILQETSSCLTVTCFVLFSLDGMANGQPEGEWMVLIKLSMSPQSLADYSSILCANKKTCNQQHFASKQVAREILDMKGRETFFERRMPRSLIRHT